MTKPPPVPPENQSPKGTGDAKSGAPQAPRVRAKVNRPGNPHQQGHQANTEQNTTIRDISRIAEKDIEARTPAP